MHVSLVSRDLNVTAAFPAATATRRIYTPWPISLGHMGLAMLMSAFQFYRLRYRSAPRITVWFLLYVINFTLSIGSVVVMVFDLRSGGRTVSVGIAQNFLNLAISSTTIPVRSQQHMRVGQGPKWTLCVPVFTFFAAIAACALYLVNGILSIVHYSFTNPYISITVYKGCPGGEQQYDTTGFSGTNYWYCPSVVSNFTYFTNDTTPGVFAQFTWILGVFVFLLLLGGFSGVRTWTQPVSSLSPAQVAESKVGYILLLAITFVNGLFATIGTGVTAGPTSERVVDCRQASWNGVGWTGCNDVDIQIPGSATGFLGIWALYKWEVAKAVFVW
jgi:hypothetical protein